MNCKESLKEYIDKDEIYQDYKQNKLMNPSDFDKFCIQHCKDIEELLEENQELKLELSGYRQAILEDKEMLGLKEENDKLKKQLEENKDNYNCLLKQKEQFEYIMSKQVDYQGQRKEFINYLEDKIKSYKSRDSYMVADILGSYDLNNIELELVEEILQKCKEIIGVSDENN